MSPEGDELQGHDESKGTGPSTMVVSTSSMGIVWGGSGIHIVGGLQLLGMVVALLIRKCLPLASSAPLVIWEPAARRNRVRSGGELEKLALATAPWL